MVISGVLVIEPILRGLPHAGYAQIYYLTPFRLDSLAAGSLLALLTEKGAFPLQRWGGWIALALAPLFMFFTVTVRNSNSLTYDILAYSFYAGIYFFLLAWVITLHGGFFNRLLSIRPLVYLGRISYGVYLFNVPAHQAMIRILHRPNPAPWDFLLVLVVAFLSYYVIEKPVMRHAKRFIQTPEMVRTT
jgi:peptidoglycan/LPS O-acetylase OafA/YrhL